MIADDHELNATLERIRHLQDQVAYLRQVAGRPSDTIDAVEAQGERLALG